MWALAILDLVGVGHRCAWHERVLPLNKLTHLIVMGSHSHHSTNSGPELDCVCTLSSCQCLLTHVGAGRELSMISPCVSAPIAVGAHWVSN
jgi:hypothetical protein